jgi:hypothetical protein
MAPWLKSSEQYPESRADQDADLAHAHHDAHGPPQLLRGEHVGHQRQARYLRTCRQHKHETMSAVVRVPK